MSSGNTGPVDRDGRWQLIIGGGWLSFGRALGRFMIGSVYRSQDIGFRLALRPVGTALTPHGTKDHE